MLECIDIICGIIFVVLFIVVPILFWKLLPSKGERGERYVAVLLKRLPEKSYRVINNLLISNDGYTSQIDHVIVSVYGIFVIETKNYIGWICGGEHSDYWTQNIYGNKYKFRNPIHQNYGHIKALKNTLKDYPNIPYISIIAFSQKASLGVSSSIPVIYWDDIVPLIIQYANKVLSESEIEIITSTLLSSNVNSIENRRHHSKVIKENVRKRKETINSGICPRCGDKLVVRNGKYGFFYGCSNYPRCKYKLNY